MRAMLTLLKTCSAGRRLARYMTCSRGVTAIEFAFVAPMVLAILLAAIQISMLYVAQSYLEAVTENTMRDVLTNQSDMYSSTNFQTALCQRTNALFNCNQMIVDLQPANCSGSAAAITSCISALQPQFDKNGNMTSTPVFQVGAQTSNMRLLVMYEWPVISGPLGLGFASFPGVGWRLLSAVDIFKREPCLVTDSKCLANG
jgi:Flp pilus assembly protein TadG